MSSPFIVGPGSVSGGSGQQAAMPPPLLIADVRIQDFRGFGDFSVSLDPLTLFVGENNSGKSSFLQALAVFFGTHRSTEDDLHVSANGHRSSRFVIDVRFVPGNGNVFDKDVQARLVGKIQIPAGEPQFFVMRAIGEADPDGSGIALDRRFLRGFSDTRAGAAALNVLPERPGREHLELVNFFLLDARRDLVEELKNRTSHWGRLLADLDVPAAARQQIEQDLEKLGQEIVDSSPVLDSVRSGLKMVKEALGTSVSDVTIAPIPGRIDDLARAVDVLITRPSGPALPLRLQGSGSRSLAAVMIFESFIKRRVGVPQGLKPLVIGAFEEPEAHLHPQAHRAMFNLIADLAGQQIVSTHSPHVARVADIHSVRVISREPGGAPRCASVPRTTGGKATFSEADLVNVRRFVYRNNGEILFARVVVVFEGDTEDFALPAFAQEYWKRDYSLLGVSFAHTDGAQSGKHVVRILESLRIPWVLLADGDPAGSKGIGSIETTINRKLTAQECVQLPKDACFEQYLLNDGYREVIEKTIGEAFGVSELSDFRKKLHGQLGRGSKPRDYKSSGWEERLVLDYCEGRKGTIGETLALGIIKHAPSLNLKPIPPAVSAVFQCASQHLK